MCQGVALFYFRCLPRLQRPEFWRTIWCPSWLPWPLQALRQTLWTTTFSCGMWKSKIFSQIRESPLVLCFHLIFAFFKLWYPFSKRRPLDVDFRELLQKFGYDYIELQLDFSMDLYPFFPPLLKVIRPRLQGSMMLRVTTIEILKLSFWNPARDMKSVLVSCHWKASNESKQLVTKSEFQ